MHIRPVGGSQGAAGGSSGSDPNSDVANCISQCQTGLYNDLQAWMKAYPNASGQELSTELNQLANKYNTQLNTELNTLRSKDPNVYGPIIDKLNPNKQYWEYEGQIQSKINYNGTTPPSSIPPPPTPGNQIDTDKEAVQAAIDKIKAEIQTFQNDLAAAQLAYQTAQTAYTNALNTINSCKDPAKKAQALIDLGKAQTALDNAKKALQTIKTDPHLTALNQQLSAARAALQTFPTTDVTKANAAAAAAKVAVTNAKGEITALNKTLTGITQGITTASGNIQQALNDINPAPPNTPVNGYNKLVIDGVTCYEVNGLIFPSGGLQGWGTSEGMGNWMRDALKNGDKALFQALLNSYYHICKQAPDHMGLMPWSIDQNGNALDKGSATDADEDIISTLIDAVAQDPNMTMTDTDGSTMKVSDMLKQAIANFAKLDCGTANGLTGGSTQWNLGPGFTDYLDPTALAKMINYCNANGMSSQATTIKGAMYSMMQYVKNELNANGGLPANGGDGSCALSRDLYRLTEFLASPLSKDYPDLKKDATTIVQNLLTKGVASGAIKIGPDGVSVQTPGSFNLAGAQASAPVYMAMQLLSDRGLLPSSLASQLANAKAALTHDMNTQFNNLHSESPSTYSNNGDYFGLTLGILCESLLKEYSS